MLISPSSRPSSRWRSNPSPLLGVLCRRSSWPLRGRCFSPALLQLLVHSPLRDVPAAVVILAALELAGIEHLSDTALGKPKDLNSLCRRVDILFQDVRRVLI